MLERLVQRDPKNFRARAAWAEVLYAKSRIFRAHAEYQRAQQDAPRDAVERHAYESAMEQLQALIESGQAIELERQADQAALERPPVPSGAVTPLGLDTGGDHGQRRTVRRGGRVRLVDNSSGLAQVPEEEPVVPGASDDAGEPAAAASASGEE